MLQSGSESDDFVVLWVHIDVGGVLTAEVGDRILTSECS